MQKKVWMYLSNVKMITIFFSMHLARLCNPVLCVGGGVNALCYVSFTVSGPSSTDLTPRSMLLRWRQRLIIDKSKFFIMSTEFNKNISDWSHSYTDHKNGIAFFMRLVKWPKIAVKKCQNLIFKVDFQHQKSFDSF